MGFYRSHKTLKQLRGLPLITYATKGRGGGGSLLYISIVFYMQRGGAGKDSILYVINGRPLAEIMPLQMT